MAGVSRPVHKSSLVVKDLDSRRRPTSPTAFVTTAAAAAVVRLDVDALVQRSFDLFLLK